MNTTQAFTTSRQKASSLALAMSITLGMLFSINMLATQPGVDPQMATQAAAHAKLACAKVGAQEG